jgi:phosphoglycolate phosphatase-like HAD superfamily hydrolase
VAATAETFAALGGPVMTAELYRATYRHPVRLFYEQVLGRTLGEAELLRANDIFRDAYHRRIDECMLTPGAQEVITAWRERGGSQSLLSLYQHDRLVPLVTRLGLAEVFLRIEGRLEDVPGQKAEYMVRHLRALGVDPACTLVVGDTVDDAHAAAHAGARCVLHDGGQQTLEVLRTAGVPVVDSLQRVLEYVDAPA